MLLAAGNVMASDKHKAPGNSRKPAPPTVIITAYPGTSVTWPELVTLVASGADSYLWSENAGSSTSATVVVNFTGDYSVTGTTNGESASADIHIDVNTGQVYSSAGFDQNNPCVGTSLTLAGGATGGLVSYTVSFRGPVPIPNPDVNAPGIMQFTATKPGYYSAGTIGTYVMSATETAATATGVLSAMSTVEIRPVLSLTATELIVDKGTSVTLNADSDNRDNDFTNYRWDGGQIGKTIVITPTESMIYSVTAVDIYNGCTYAESIRILACDPLLAAQIGSVSFAPPIGNERSLQITGVGTTYVVTGPGGYVFSQVFRGQASRTVTIPAGNLAGRYTVTVSNRDACGRSDTITRTIELPGI
ncbi:hypothetical protein BLX24_00235 [Arsenicibacter rosenii]|uniref:Uncharacterized protein n=2 Tax=Arsenicibacter rosenii TaxID=1750698 RepID=A0A1S2VPC0_9BACT|nr:hypothetical protein BLX24_00235 [Arsenicibacter rosenii]